MSYHVFVNGVEMGPLELKDLQKLLSSEQITQECMTRSGNGAWQPLRFFPEVFEPEKKMEAAEESSVPEGVILSDDGTKVRLICPLCQQKYSIADRSVGGQKVNCSSCGGTFRLPDLRAPEAKEFFVDDVGDDWEQCPDGSILCPHCWKSFDPDSMLYISVHPSLYGDPVLGELEPTRFRPTVYNNLGQPLDSCGVPASETACPRCHLRVPASFIDIPMQCFSIAGAISSGKSYFLTCLVHTLRESLSLRFSASFHDLDPRLNETLNNYEKQLFMALEPDKITALPATQIAGEGISDRVLMNDIPVELPKPFCFEFCSGDGLFHQNLTFYDNSGEMFTPGRDSWGNQATFHLSHSSGIMFLFDPANDAGMLHKVCDPADPQVSQKPRSVDQALLLSELISRIRRHANMLSTEKCDIPLVVVIGKYDVWRKHFNRELSQYQAIRREPSGENALDWNVVSDISFAARDFLLQYAPGLVNTAEGFFETVYFVPVSNFGTVARADDSGLIGIVPNELSPIWVDVPMLVLLARLGFIPSSRKSGPVSHGTECDARIISGKVVLRDPRTGMNVHLPLNYAGTRITIGGTEYQLPEYVEMPEKNTGNVWK